MNTANSSQSETSLNIKKSKTVYKGWFNFSHELHVMYAQAYSERQAWMHFCRRIAKKHDVPLRMVMGHFDGSIDNYVIKKEEGNEPTV